MKSLMISLLLVLVAALPPALSHAEVPVRKINISSGVVGGAYHTFTKEAIEACGRKGSVVFANLESKQGGQGNLTALEGNQATMGLMQRDTLAFHGKGRDLGFLRLLLPLFPESVLFIARSDLIKTTKGTGWAGSLTSTKTPVTSLTDLAGITVYAAGGALDSAYYVQDLTKVAYSISPVVDPNASSKTLVEDVVNGKRDVVVVTGANPIAWLASLPADKAQKLRLLEIPKTAMDQLATAYNTGPVSYPSMAQGPKAVMTITVNSVLVVKNVSDSVVAPEIARFRNCIIEVAPTMAASDGTSPVWRHISPTKTSSALPLWTAPSPVPTK